MHGGIQADMLSPKQAAEFLGRTVYWLKLCRKDGDGPPWRKMRGRIVYLRSEIQSWFDSLRRG